VAEHLAALWAHRILEQDAGPPEERTLEGLARQIVASENGQAYDEIAAELDAVIESDGDPFAAVNNPTGKADP